MTQPRDGEQRLGEEGAPRRARAHPPPEPRGAGRCEGPGRPRYREDAANAAAGRRPSARLPPCAGHGSRGKGAARLRADSAKCAGNSRGRHGETEALGLTPHQGGPGTAGLHRRTGGSDARCLRELGPDFSGGRRLRRVRTDVWTSEGRAVWARGPSPGSPAATPQGCRLRAVSRERCGWPGGHQGPRAAGRRWLGSPSSARPEGERRREIQVPRTAVHTARSPRPRPALACPARSRPPAARAKRPHAAPEQGGRPGPQAAGAEAGLGQPGQGRRGATSPGRASGATARPSRVLVREARPGSQGKRGPEPQRRVSAARAPAAQAHHHLHCNQPTRAGPPAWFWAFPIWFPASSLSPETFPPGTQGPWSGGTGMSLSWRWEACCL